MVSAVMDIQDQSGYYQSNGVFRTVNRVSLDGGASHSLNTVHPKEQFSSGNDSALKVRKPYTITKQRERWTEQEHNKFIDALKLYGRSWRRIEEHVGTKTAVQIRSHSQKFFSKVVRQSSNAAANSVKPIEVPPPRPKRKPAHPYPRKLVSPLKKGTSVLEQQTMSGSPNSYISDQENQSPTSILSAYDSEILGTMDSNTPNGSLLPVSSADSFLVCEPNSSPEEVGSPIRSSPDEDATVNLELFPPDKAIIAEWSVDLGSTRSFKLFGTNMLVKDSDKLNKAFCEPSGQSLPCQFSGMSMEGKWDPPMAEPAAFCYMQLSNENPNPADGVSGPPRPWWSYYGNAPFTSFPWQGSWTGSNTGSVNSGVDGDMNWKVRTQSGRVSCEEEENVEQSKLRGKSSENSSFSEQRMALDKCLKGFVPYKRCLADRHTQSSTIASDEREDQRIRLFL